MLRAALLVSALLLACGETAQPPDADVAQGGSSAGRPAGGAGAGNDPGSSGSLMSDGGSLGGAAEHAGDAGPILGGALNGGAGADAGSSGLDSSLAGDGGAAGAGSEATRVCALAASDGQNLLDQSSQIGSNYRQVLASECRYSGLSCGVDINAKIDFANGLRSYGPDLWHCDGGVAREFRLVYRGRTVTEADGEALVDLYVLLTTRRLLLSASDAAGLRKELLALMPASLAADAAPISLCDSGGACPLSGPSAGAGNGGTGGSIGGTGGAPNQAGAN